jgi:hypothetical protein
MVDNTSKVYILLRLKKYFAKTKTFAKTVFGKESTVFSQQNKNICENKKIFATRNWAKFLGECKIFVIFTFSRKCKKIFPNNNNPTIECEKIKIQGRLLCMVYRAARKCSGPMVFYCVPREEDEEEEKKLKSSI